MKFLSRKFKNDGYYHISIALALIGIGVYLITHLNFLNIKGAIIDNILLFPQSIRKGHKLWTFFTYQFYTSDIFSVLFDAIFLLWCGEALERTIGSKEFLLYYVLCNIFMAMVYFALGFIPHKLFLAFSVFPLGSCGALDAALLFMFSYYARNIKVLLFFVLPVSAPIVLVIILALRLLSIATVGLQAALPGIVCYCTGLIYAVLYMSIRMRKDIKTFLKSIVGIR